MIHTSSRNLLPENGGKQQRCLEDEREDYYNNKKNTVCQLRLVLPGLEPQIFVWKWKNRRCASRSGELIRFQ